MISNIYDVCGYLLTVDSAESAARRVEDCHRDNIIICIVIDRGIIIDPENQVITSFIIKWATVGGLS